MSARSEFRAALRDRDIPLLIKASAVLFPDAPVPTEAEALVQMHVARTMQGWMTIEERSYSHFWLLEQGLPSMLPPELLPKADRYRPEAKSAVGIVYATGKEWLKPAAPIIGMAMAKAVSDNAELIETDPELLRDKIAFAKSDEFQRLFGVLTALEVER